MKMTFLAVVVLSPFLGGCQNPEVIQISPGVYLLGRDDHGGVFGNKNALKAGVIRDANAFAEKQGKVAIPVSSKDHPVGVMGDWASFEYQFRLVDKDDPQARDVTLVPRADLVIEKNERVTVDIRSKDVSEKTPDLYADLMKLDDLRKKGLITDAEFEAQKQKLLQRAK